MEYKSYAAVKEGKIVSIFKTKECLSIVEKAFCNNNIIFDDVKIFPADWKGRSGYRLNEFDNFGNLLSLQTRIDKKIIECPPEMKVVGEELIEKSEQEKIIDGLIETPRGKIVKNNHIEEMTYDEKKSSNQYNSKELKILWNDVILNAKLQAKTVLTSNVNRGFNLDGVYIQCNKESINAIITILSHDNLEFPISWRTFENTYLQISTFEELKRLKNLMIDYSTIYIQDYWLVVDAIIKCKTEFDVLQIIKEYRKKYEQTS